jgi:signal transduction histidine kinase
VRRYFLRHPVRMDALVAALYAVPAVIGAVLAETAPAAPLIVVALLGGAVLLRWRRRAPLRAAAAIGVLAVACVGALGTLNGLDLAIAFVVYAVAASARPRTAWVTLGTLVLAASVAVLLWERRVGDRLGPGVSVETGSGDVVGDRVGSVTGLLILSLVAIAVGTGTRNRRLHVAALVDRANALAVERGQQAQLAAAAERARIAREMHDVVAHSLSVMIALADGAAAAVPRSPASAQAAITQVSETGRAALTDMRRVLGVLRDDDASYGPPPGGTDLAALVEGYRRAGLPVHLTVAGLSLPPDTGLQLAVYRIVQEALTNALRHTRGTGRVDARVAHADGRVEIEVVDDGGVAHPGGPPPTPGSGRGIIGMRERAAIYGGTVEAGPSGSGWRVRTALHWDEEST